MAGIELLLNQGAESPAPLCPHGPTLLFAKINRKEQETRRFYACSACRDRKDCNFFQWENEKVSVARLLAREEFNQSRQPPFTHKQYVERYQHFVSLPEVKRIFCLDCQLLLLPADWDKHTSHQQLGDVSLHQLKRPSKLLLPLENKKTNAQYLFADRTCQFLLDLIVSLGFRKVLCVGTPRLHELIKLRQFEKNNPVIKSQLLDIDFRYSQFYSEEEFCHYNMFNHHFFGEKSAFEAFRMFMCQDNGVPIIMVTDPPFGGLVEALAHSFKKIVATWKTSQNEDDELPIFWIFPYFFEPRILQCFPTFSMLDYQVDYDNHALYKHGNSGRKQSPVRIFTNLLPKTVILPAEEGYRYCSLCQRYVSSANRHCEICQACTSKDGKEWKHCHICNKCVKQSWFHCETCSHCVLRDHSCGGARSGCFICGSTDHKRRECPDTLVQNKITEKSRPHKRKHFKMNKKDVTTKSKQQAQAMSTGKKKTMKRITAKSKKKKKRKSKQLC